MDQETMRQQASELLWAIWRGVHPELKSRYRRTIWEQFENTVRASAYTDNLGKFLDTLCLRMQATVGLTAEERSKAMEVLDAAEPRTMLKLLREETALLVLMVRLRNQDRQDEFRARESENVEFEEAMES